MTCTAIRTKSERLHVYEMEEGGRRFMRLIDVHDSVDLTPEAALELSQHLLAFAARCAQ